MPINSLSNVSSVHGALNKKEVQINTKNLYESTRTENGILGARAGFGTIRESSTSDSKFLLLHKGGTLLLPSYAKSRDLNKKYKITGDQRFDDQNFKAVEITRTTDNKSIIVLYPSDKSLDIKQADYEDPAPK